MPVLKCIHADDTCMPLTHRRDKSKGIFGAYYFISQVVKMGFEIRSHVQTVITSLMPTLLCNSKKCVLIGLLRYFCQEQSSVSFSKVSSYRVQSHAASNLTHWGRVTHICVSKFSILGSDNGLSPGRRQAIIWTNAGLLLIGPLGTNFNEMLIKIHTFCLGLNVLNGIQISIIGQQ